MIRKLLLSGVSAAAIICANTAGAATFTFGFTGGVESGAIETSGTYELRLRGADGGAATDFLDNARGGFGALLLGEIDLLAGDLFRVLVGGNGQSGYDAGGGGGLSYFSSGSNLAIAGGGGGASGSWYLEEADGGSDAYGHETGSLGSGGRDALSTEVYYSNYGPQDFQFYSGNGGAGWNSSGQGSVGGQSGPNWTGGDDSGGFGGGGGTGYSGAVELGGGGAGAYGGNSGSTESFIAIYQDGSSFARQGSIYGATGGGSYFSSAFLNTSSVVGQARVGGAYLTLDLLAQPAPAPAPVPLPASAVLLGSTIAGMGFVARRRKKKS